MFKQLIAFSCSLVLIVSCQKDMTRNKTLVDNTATDKTVFGNEITEKAVVSSAHWYGGYTDLVCTDPNGLCDPDVPSVFDYQMIHDGVAQDPDLSSFSFTYSNINFDIPSPYNIAGDSITFQAVVMNAETTGFPGYDVALQIEGSQHSAELHFVANATTQPNNQYYIGNARYYNLPQLVHDFGTFQTIKWVMKKNGTAAYINGKLAYRFTYGAANRIGTIKTITVAGGGYIVVNSVKLLNSYTNKKIMVEDFDVDGQSHTIFY